MADIDQMLGQISFEKFLEWRTYDQLEPFGPKRDDYRAASIVQALWNIARDPKRNPNGWPIDDFLLLFGDDQNRGSGSSGGSGSKQSVETLELLLNDWIWSNNAIIEAKQSAASAAAAAAATTVIAT